MGPFETNFLINLKLYSSLSATIKVSTLRPIVDVDWGKVADRIEKGQNRLTALSTRKKILLSTGVKTRTQL